MDARLSAIVLIAQGKNLRVLPSWKGSTRKNTFIEVVSEALFLHLEHHEVLAVDGRLDGVAFHLRPALLRNDGVGVLQRVVQRVVTAVQSQRRGVALHPLPSPVEHDILVLGCSVVSITFTIYSSVFLSYTALVNKPSSPLWELGASVAGTTFVCPMLRRHTSACTW